MALTEIQMPTKGDLYANLKSTAGDLLRLMLKFEQVYEFIDKVDTADLDSMGVPTGQIRVDLNDLRNTLSEFVTLWNNGSITPTKDPQAVVDKIRGMSVI